MISHQNGLAMACPQPWLFEMAVFFLWGLTLPYHLFKLVLKKKPIGIRPSDFWKLQSHNSGNISFIEGVQTVFACSNVHAACCAVGLKLRPFSGASGLVADHGGSESRANNDGLRGPSVGSLLAAGVERSWMVSISMWWPWWLAIAIGAGRWISLTATRTCLSSLVTGLALFCHTSFETVSFGQIAFAKDQLAKWYQNWFFSL